MNPCMDRQAARDRVEESWPPTYDLERLGCESWDEEPATAREVDGLMSTLSERQSQWIP